ncbi:MAG: thioredoxin [Eubacteriaceae bacterium]|nr:thioredoxin [Eubacteriaceae bacterium]
MAIITITKENFVDEVLNTEETVLLDFWADWCGPCKVISPFIDEIAEEMNNIKVCKVNVDEEPEIAGSLNVMSIPTLAVFRGGKMVQRASGARPKEEILSLLEV